MMINHLSKRVIPFRPHDAKRVGEGCYYLDLIVWLNGDRIEMGDGVGLANHHYDDRSRPVTEQGWREQPVTVGPRTWIGMAACILPGVTIGEGAIVGAGAVVTKDVEPWVIAAGNPARTIKERP
jgi:acetyltransferase-like isoleucine patch superfamily enzyme